VKPRTVACVLLLCASASPALAEEDAWTLHKRPPFVVQGTALFGDGLRFDNPYRLSTVLGSDAQSVSRTAAYVDFGLAAAFGDPRSFQHGLAVRTSVAVEGVGQVVLTPSYLLYRRIHAFGFWGRAGTPLVLTPGTTWGLEAAAGAAWFVRAGIGLAAEVVGDLFWGTGTRDVAVASYPLLSAQLGLIVSYEVLP
jgi:hypothetical protein